MNRRFVVILPFVLCACPGEGTGPGGNMAYCDTVTAVSLECDVQPVFSANCALSGCHVSPTPAQNQNLSAGQAYQSIVNVQSEQSALLRVDPGRPDSSYLVHKIQGTQASVGGSMDTRMPLGGTPLSQQQIDLIRAWIETGALDN